MAKYIWALTLLISGFALAEQKPSGFYINSRQDGWLLRAVVRTPFKGNVEVERSYWERRKSTGLDAIRLANLTVHRFTWDKKIAMPAKIAEEIMRNNILIYSLPKQGLYKSKTVEGLWAYENFWVQENSYIKMYLIQRPGEIVMTTSTNRLLHVPELLWEIDAVHRGMLAVNGPKKSAFLRWLDPLPRAFAATTVPAFTVGSPAIDKAADSVSKTAEAVTESVKAAQNDISGIDRSMQRTADSLEGIDKSAQKFERMVDERLSRDYVIETAAFTAAASVITAGAIGLIGHAVASGASYLAKNFYYWWTKEMPPDIKKYYEKHKDDANHFAELSKKVTELDMSVDMNMLALRKATEGKLDYDQLVTQGSGLIDQRFDAQTKLEAAREASLDSCREDLLGINRDLEMTVSLAAHLKKNPHLANSKLSVCMKLEQEMEAWRKYESQMDKFRLNLSAAIVNMISEKPGVLIDHGKYKANSKQLLKRCEATKDLYELKINEMKERDCNYSLDSLGYASVSNPSQDCRDLLKIVKAQQSIYNTCRETAEKAGAENTLGIESRISQSMSTEASELAKLRDQLMCSSDKTGCEASEFDKLVSRMNNNFKNAAKQCQRYTPNFKFNENIVAENSTSAEGLPSTDDEKPAFVSKSSRFSAPMVAVETMPSQQKSGWFSRLGRSLSQGIKGFFSKIGSIFSRSSPAPASGWTAIP